MSKIRSVKTVETIGINILFIAFELVLFFLTFLMRMKLKIREYS